MKRCKSCLLEKSLDCFYFFRTRNWYSAQCKGCYAVSCKAYRDTNPDKQKELYRKRVLRNSNIVTAETRRVCRVCLEEKDISLFNRSITGVNGRSTKCKNCSRSAHRQYREKNQERYAEYKRGNYIRHSEKKRLASKRWRTNNPEKLRVQWKNRRALKKLATGSFTSEEWESLKRKFKYVCLRCNRKEPEIKLTADHVIPLKLGGTNFIENIQPLCFSCNSSKKIKILDFREDFGSTGSPL